MLSSQTDNMYVDEDSCNSTLLHWSTLTKPLTMTLDELEMLGLFNHEPSTVSC